MRVQDSGFRCCASGGSALPLAGKAAGLIEEESFFNFYTPAKAVVGAVFNRDDPGRADRHNRGCPA